VAAGGGAVESVPGPRPEDVMSDLMPDDAVRPAPVPDLAAPAPEAQAEAAPTARSRWHGLWREWVRPFLVVVVVVFSLRSAVADWNDVPTGSMRPTILEGERIFVNKLAYDLKLPFTRLRLVEWSEPGRGDIVVLYSPADGQRLVKRVVGLPGDRITLSGGRLLVNGERADYRPLGEAERAELGIDNGALEPEEFVVWETIDGARHPVAWQAPRLGLDDGTRAFGYSPAIDWGPGVVPVGQYFVMGDNRDNSKDSRVIGYIDRDRIVGRATAVVVSLDPDHHRAPRWGRFFQALP